MASVCKGLSYQMQASLKETLPEIWGLELLCQDPPWESKAVQDGSEQLGHGAQIRYYQKGTLISYKCKWARGHWTYHAESWIPGEVRAAASIDSQ